MKLGKNRFFEGSCNDVQTCMGEQFLSRWSETKNKLPFIYKPTILLKNNLLEAIR